MIHGLVPCHKPTGFSSHDVVAILRKIFSTRKAGHFGTLDPEASGLLLVGLGHVTKFFDFYQKREKHYSGLIRFGQATTTYDREGEPLGEERPIDLHQIDVPALLSAFLGQQMQIPPIYSAKKFKGRPLYAYARNNQEEEVEVKPQEINVLRLSGHIVDERTLHFDIAVSSGTYIRSLAHDMGQRTGAGAHLFELRRDGIGDFKLDQAFTLEQIKEHVANGDLNRVVIPIESLLPEFTKIVVNYSGRRGVCNGQTVKPTDVLQVCPGTDLEHVRFFDDNGKLLALGSKDPQKLLFKPTLVFPEG